MTFENAFTVQAPIDEVWSTLLDVERVAPCMPGAEVTERVGDDAYKVAVKVKVGPMSMTYRGEVQIVDRDEHERQATMHVKAKEARGQGTADAHVRMSLADDPGGTRATIETEVQMSGKVAAMGQSVIAEVSAKLIETFAANLAEMLSNGAGPADLPVEPRMSAGPAGGSSAAVADASSIAPPPAAARRASPAQSALPVGEIAAGVIAGRLGKPRTLLAVTAAFAVVFLAIGFVIGRAS
jgi:carbon monoxide dehydrogenase subunit G